MSDWRIELEPAGRNHPCLGGTLEIVDGDANDAVEALEGWAAAINALGFVPEGLDWLNRSGAVVTSRQGRFRFRVRVDSFEVELPSGELSSGAAALVAREVPE